MFDRRVRELQRYISTEHFTNYYEKPELMIKTIYDEGYTDKVWAYAENFAKYFGEIPNEKKPLTRTELSEYMATI